MRGRPQPAHFTSVGNGAYATANCEYERLCEGERWLAPSEQPVAEGPQRQEPAILSATHVAAVDGEFFAGVREVFQVPTPVFLQRVAREDAEACEPQTEPVGELSSI